ncbi:hypothetical protein MUK42_34148 [Musa troglodytarum]|uniref:Uncharacterized protein n=1 Tax=Musa troglodytarum TaxID=320322 RepID=A0A9E7FTI5_9LILI|nr:hypothetical protein MUK42_34148 [Musa troglodytarum]
MSNLHPPSTKFLDSDGGFPAIARHQMPVQSIGLLTMMKSTTVIVAFGGGDPLIQYSDLFWRRRIGLHISDFGKQRLQVGIRIELLRSNVQFRHGRSPVRSRKSAAVDSDDDYAVKAAPPVG